MANVFLSYDHEDVALARPLAGALEKAGHTVWYDRHIHGGAQYSRKIEQALDAADAVVVLWSPRSLESAWVRDEAAEGRDRGKLVPLSVGGVKAPMGFRQFQTIDLGAWTGRGTVPNLPEMLNAIAEQAQQPGRQAAPVAREPALPKARPRRSIIIAAAALLVALALLAGGWAWLKRSNMPVVAVAAADASPRSQAAASDLFVKLGSLAQIGEGKWQLVDAASAPARPHLIFRTADTGSAAQPRANLVLLDGKDDSLLWSREFSFPPGREADLRQQLSLAAGRVLGCALESRDAGGLRRNLLKLFLNACAILAETSMEDPEKVTSTLRSIVASEPRFLPAWARLLSANANLVDVARNGGGDVTAATAGLQRDMAQVERIAPDLPQLTLAKMELLPKTAYGKGLDLLEKAAEQAPTNPESFTLQTGELQRVGRMTDAVASARRAAELDPLSPSVTTYLIMALAYAGQTGAAREELARAEQLWAGTDALRDALWSFHLRYGDPALARKYARSLEGLDVYLRARTDPSPANVEALAAYMRPLLAGEVRGGPYGWAVQALGEFNRVDEAIALIGRAPTDIVAESAYLLFRPALAGLRRDPRFMSVARRIGLVAYWRSSGRWPDFCNDPQLPYDCKAEAAKYG